MSRPLNIQQVLVTFSADSTTSMQPIGEVQPLVLCTMLADSLCLAIAQAKQAYPDKNKNFKQIFLDHIQHEVE
jgi:hypothetical protein